VDSPTEPRPVPASAPPPPSEARQRWRLTFSRLAAGDGETPAGRDYIALWETALAESGLPVARTDAGRFRFALGAPLPARTAGLAELADLWLTERTPAWEVREGLERVLPAGHTLVALEDVWPGAPALAGRVAAAEYRVTLGGSVDAEATAAATGRLLAADRIPRERAKGGGVKTYDLRPLLMSIQTAAEAGEAGGEERVVVRIRTRIHPELGSGRPEEVIAALSDELNATLEPVEMVRERLLLLEDVEG
jgi:radical SAM-linked protein